MDVVSKKGRLFGHIQVPGSKSHTIRALLFASIAEGISRIKNPLGGEDCVSASRAIELFGAEVDTSNVHEWVVKGAGRNAHLPQDVVNVGNSGSLLYFMAPIAATFEGWSIFTGDKSIRTRPVLHLVDALNQLGAECVVSRPKKNAPPILIKGPVKAQQKLVTDGRLSQYISGIMMAASLLDGTTEIELTDPKEIPFLNMTRMWLEWLGVPLEISSDWKYIKITGPVKFNAFDKTVPSDWEAVAFPMLASILSESEIGIDDIDNSGSQGDSAIVDIFKSLGANITENKKDNSLFVKGGARLSTENLPNGELHANLSGYPDAICALAVCACFTEGSVFIEDIGVCRKKETDRIEVMQSELKKLGADIDAGDDWLCIRGHSPILKNGKKNPEFKIHGGTVESYGDHRVAMSLSCLGLGLSDGEKITVRNAECCSVSFPKFYEKMNKIGADFKWEV